MNFIALKTEDGRQKGKITFFCKVLDVSRQGFYQYLINRNRPWKYQKVAELIQEICHEDLCNDTYGRIRMYQALQLKNPDSIPIPSESTVYRIMKKLGLVHHPKRKTNGITKADREAMKSDDLLKRDFYAAMCMQENWSVRTLRERKKSMLYERTAISKKPEETIKNEISELRDDGKMKEYSIFGESDKEAIVTLFSLQINGIQGSSKEFAEEMEKREDALCGEILKKIETHEELRNQEMKKIKDMAVFMNTNGMEVKK